MRKRKILSWLLSVAIVATMIMPMPLSVSAAETKPDVTSEMGKTENDFVEWDFAEFDANTFIYHTEKDCSDVGSTSATAGDDAQNYIKPTTDDKNIGASLNLTRSGTSAPGAQFSSGTNAVDYTTIGGNSHNKGSVNGGKFSVHVTYTIDPNLDKEKYQFANVYIGFGINNGSGNAAQTGHFTCGSDQSAEVYSAANESGLKYATFKIEDVTGPITLKADKEPLIYHIGIEYIADPNAPAPDAYSKPGGGTTTYTWDFTDATWFTSGYSVGAEIISSQKEEKAILTNPGSKINSGANSWPDSGYDTKPLAKLNDISEKALQFDIPKGLSAKLKIEIGSTSNNKSWYLRNGISDTTAATKERIATITAAKKYYYGTPNEFDVECGKTYYLDTSDSNGFLGKITLTVTKGAEAPEGFDEVTSTYDSGIYGTDPQLGVIRFFQGYTGEAIEEFGFYFVSKDGDILDESYTINNPKASFDISNNEGFYGDLNQIPKDKWNNLYYAMAYVKKGGKTEMSNIVIPGKVHPKNVLTNYSE